MEKINIFILFVILFIVGIAGGILVFQKESFHNYSVSQTLSKCSASSCGNIDPVSDPRYNMQQIVKQSILLEEHLANKQKRCRDCITKHFLHIIGLAEEAQMLATDKIDKYPFINECVELYNKLFKKWIKAYDYDMTNVDNYLVCCDELRTMRKKLIAAYFFNDISSD